MSVPSDKEFPSQQSSDKAYPSKGISQFKAPLKLQSGALREQGQRFSIQGSTPSKGTSQFKAPLKFQSGTLREQSRPYAAFGASPSNSASLYHVTDPLQPLVPQLEKWSEQSGYHPPFGMHLSNTALQDSVTTMPLPRVQALPSIDARNTYSAGDPITHKSSVLTIHLSTDPYIGILVPHSSPEAPRQSAQFLRESNRSWQSALPQTEPLVGSESLRKNKDTCYDEGDSHGRNWTICGRHSFLLVIALPYLPCGDLGYPPHRIIKSGQSGIALLLSA